MNAKEFYQNNTQQDWDILLKPVDYHYHIGFPGKTDNIFKNAIYENLFPFIKDGSKVLDCGCGWGGTAKMLMEEKGCDVTCITNSEMQVNFLKERQYKVIEKDLSYFIPEEQFDVAFLYESFCHVRHKQLLLKNLSLACKEIVFIAHLSEDSIAFSQDEWSAQFISIPKLINYLYNVGYKLKSIKHLDDILIESTLDYWKSKLDIIKPAYGQLKTLEELVDKGLEMKYALYSVHASL